MKGVVSVVDSLTIVVVAALAMLVVAPRMRVRRLLANEDAVIADLADIERREDKYKASGATDRDGDGKGEYAPLGEVLGERASQFERIEGADIWRREGYYFTVLLPDREYKPVPASSPDVAPDYAEVAELIVAWPADPGTTGMRAYCRWPGGVLLQHGIDGYPYTREPPYPRAPLIKRDGNGAHPADRYDRVDWNAPAFETPKPAAR
jgi:hypothetical protein